MNNFRELGDDEQFGFYLPDGKAIYMCGCGRVGVADSKKDPKVRCSLCKNSFIKWVDNPEVAFFINK